MVWRARGVEFDLHLMAAIADISVIGGIQVFPLRARGWFSFLMNQSFCFIFKP